MAKRSKLEGVSVGDVVNIVNEGGGQSVAADKFDVSQAAISQFLRKHNYRAVTLYVGEGETVTISESGASVPFTTVDGRS